MRGHFGDGDLQAHVALLRRKGQLVAKWTNPHTTTMANLRKARVNDLTSVISELVVGEAIEAVDKNDYRAIVTPAFRLARRG